VLVSAGAQGALSSNPTCGSYGVGPGTHTSGSTNGARCLLREFDRCHAASYWLSRFGVDTIAVDDFTVANADGHCFISVETSLRVVPQQAKPQGTSFCASLKAEGTDVVAVDCTGGNLPKTVSLTGRT
jgi:hypothetical protein